MKQAKIFGGICAAVAMLIGGSCAYADTVIGQIEVYRGAKGDKGEPGVGITYKGEVENCAGLAGLTGMVQGDAYYNRAEGLLYIYNGTVFPTCPGGGVPFKGEQGEQGPQGPQGPQGNPGTDACIPAFSSSHSEATRKTTVRYTCGTTDETFEIADGADGDAPCTPTFTSSHDATARKTTVRYACGETNQTFEIADGNNGAGICDGVANPATAVKTYTKTYTEHTSTTPGYVVLSQTMCDNSTNTTNYEDTCVPIVPNRTAQNICSNGTYMECKAQQGGTVYNICKALSTENASTISAAISTAQSAAESAQSTADNAISKAEAAQNTANSTANKVDNTTTGLAATYSLASQANSELANKLSKNVTFATETVNGVSSYVLKEGNTTVATLAAKSDLKGESPCPNGMEVRENASLSTTDKTTYDVVCKE